MSDTAIRRCVIIGMGALGMMYGERISAAAADGSGIELKFLMDEAHMKKVTGRTFCVNGRPQHFTTALPGETGIADLVIVATKTTALESAIDLMKSCTDEHTVIISVCNGITSEEIIASRFGRRNIVYCVAQGMDAVRLGDNLNYTKMGLLFLGNNAEALPRLTEFFDRAGIAYECPEDIMLRMWKKFMLNCGINQACMVYGTTYGEAVKEGSEVYNTFVSSMREVQALAALEGYVIDDSDIEFYINLMTGLNPDGMPSMAQDRIARRRSEVETFAGTVIRLAEKHGLAVPVNRELYKRVAAIESTY